MKFAPLFALLMFLSALSFAATMDECVAMEDTCMRNCCTDAGGHVEGSAEEELTCVGDVADEAAASAAYDSCITGYCRPTAIECVAPTGQCSAPYTACYNSCVSNGNDPATCDDNCFNQAMTCVGNYLEGEETGGGCCGPAVILGFVLIGAFAIRKD